MIKKSSAWTVVLALSLAASLSSATRATSEAQEADDQPSVEMVAEDGVTPTESGPNGDAVLESCALTGAISTPNDLHAGDSYRLDFWGFEPGSSVTVRFLTSTNRQIDSRSHTASSACEIAARFTVASTRTAGNYKWRAEGRSYWGGRLALDAPMTVRPNDGRSDWLPLTGRYVPKGQAADVAAPYYVCRYPTIHVDCMWALSSNHAFQVSVLETVRNASDRLRAAANASAWERSVRPDPGEEAVLVRLRVTHTKAERGGTTYNPSEMVIDLSVRDGWVSSGGTGRAQLVYVPAPELRSDLRVGATVEGWIAGYVPQGADFVLAVSEHPASSRSAGPDKVYLATK